MIGTGERGRGGREGGRLDCSTFYRLKRKIGFVGSIRWTRAEERARLLLTRADTLSHYRGLLGKPLALSLSVKSKSETLARAEKFCRSSRLA